ncbi:MAG: PQQ-binding-like beta-propeller repeat protein [archaeon]|nr:PQQ-binding-like beta-propeller repeat protein [Candidatus Bathyarchaeum sp.]
MLNAFKKSKLSTIALVLMITLSTLMIALPTASAQATHKQAYPYIGAIPNPVGVNQMVLLHIGITDSTQTTEDGFENLTVTVTDPEGNTQTLGPYTTDSTGGTGDVFTPSMAGTYQLVTNFPAQWYNYTGTYYGMPVTYATYYEEAHSDVLELIVEDVQVEYYPAASLPEEYWTRPIDSQLREWNTIAGNWLMTPDNLYAQYNDDAPNTVHILWRKTLTTGGLVGGELGDHSFETGDAYEGFWSNSVVVAGKLYYNKYKSGYPTQEVVAVDLHTGEELWCKTLGNNEQVAYGQTFFWSSYNYHGTFDYIWTLDSAPGIMGLSSTNWHAYDPINGELVYSMEGVPGGHLVVGPNGEFLIYTVGSGYMTMWNSTHVVSDSGSWMAGFSGAGFGTYNASAGYQWNVTIPTDLVGTAHAVVGDRIIGVDVGSTFVQDSDGTPIEMWALDISEGNEGEVLFDTTWTPPAGGNLSFLWSAASFEDGVFVISAKESRTHYAFDIDTGDLAWSTDPQFYMDMWVENAFINLGVNIAYNKLFSVGYGGTVYCYDITDGSLLWTYDAVDTYSEILWGNSWPLDTLFFADEKVYIAHSEHSPLDPKARGAPFICLDANTGDEVFRVDGIVRSTVWGGDAVIGDSIIATMNTYDQQIYAFGKGASQLTAEIQNNVVSLGSVALVTGTVMDVSPGTNEAGLAIRFPDGVAAISDADMGDWMKYVYQQAARPDDAEGVEVVLSAVTPDGNCIDIDRTTSDSYGNWALAFTPEMEGTYTIIATFEGSEGYYGSTQTTYLNVGPAPTAATPIDNEPVDEPVDTEEPTGFVISTELAIIAAVAVAAVIGVAAYFLLKRK